MEIRKRKLRNTLLTEIEMVKFKNLITPKMRRSNPRRRRVAASQLLRALWLSQV